MAIIEENVIEVFMEEEMAEGFVNYSRELLENRSFPSVYDGLKPVQRKIIYGMHGLRLEYPSPHKKSARVVGEVMGKYHPHGDSSIYGSMVLLGQWWSVRYPLVDIHGNSGSIDGDSAAAMRYTEARLMPMVEEFTKDLGKNCVPMVNNFDDSLKEPEILPTVLPFYLLNGSMGIAVGLSCDIPSHNLGELIDTILAYMENPKLTIKELLKILKGPDLPTGGIVEGKNLLEIYTKGTGNFKVRAKYKLENGSRDKTRIIITEIPFQTNKSKILAQLSDMYMSKNLEGVNDIRDESSLEDGIRIVLEVKKDIDPNYILKKIFAKTNLEMTQKVNLRAFIDGKPELLSLTDYFDYYLAHQKELLIKKTTFILEKKQKELHLLEGYLRCLADIDKAVQLIKKSRKSETAKKALMKEFQLDEEQAQAVLDLRLRSLTTMEKTEIRKKKKALDADIVQLKKILSSDKAIYTELTSELLRLKEVYGDKRRSKIQTNFKKIEAEKPVVEFYVSVKDKTIKTYQTKNFKFDGDFLIETDNTKELVLITENGGFYKFPHNKIPSKVPLSVVGGFASDFSDNDERIVTIITRGGMIKRTAIKEYGIRRTQSDAIRLNVGDSVLKTFITDNLDRDILVVSKQHYVNKFHMNDVALSGRVTKGVRAIRKITDDELIDAAFMEDVAELVMVYSDQTVSVPTRNIRRQQPGGARSFKRTGNGLKGLLRIKICYKSEKQAD